MLRLASSANRSSVSDRKDRERGHLFWFLSRFGVDMPSCSRCEKRKLRCVADARRGNRCAECVKDRQIHCDVFGVPVPEVERMVREEEVLRQKVEKASRELGEAASRFTRLQQQQDKLREEHRLRLEAGNTRLREMAAQDHAEGLDLFPDDPFIEPGDEPWGDLAFLAQLGVDLGSIDGTTRETAGP